MKRLRRSASSMTVPRSSTLLAGVERSVEVPQRAGGPEYGGERRPEIVRDRGQQRLPQPVRFGQQLRPVEVLDEANPLDRQPALVGQRIEEPSPLGRQDRPRDIAVDADDADRAPARVHRQEEALGARQGVGAPARGPVVVEAPFGGPDVGLVELVLGRVAGRDRDAPRLRQEHHDPDLQHRRDLEHRRPQHVVEVAATRELAAEAVERLRGAGAPLGDHGFRAGPGREVRHEERHHREEEQGRDIARVRDGEGVERRQEEEVVAQRSAHHGAERRVEAEPDRDHDHRGEEHDFDALHREEALHDQRDAERDRDREGRRESRAWRRRTVRPARPGHSCAARVRRPRRHRPAMTWTLMLPERCTRSCTIEPCSSSKSCERSDLPITIWVTLLSRA